MLLLNYLLNVAVGISAGIGAVVSAIPALHPYTLPFCLLVLITLTFLNLRGMPRIGAGLHHPGDRFHWVHVSCHCYRTVRHLAKRRATPPRCTASANSPGD